MTSFTRRLMELHTTCTLGLVALSLGCSEESGPFSAAGGLAGQAGSAPLAGGGAGAGVGGVPAGGSPSAGSSSGGSSSGGSPNGGIANGGVAGSAVAGSGGSSAGAGGALSGDPCSAQVVGAGDMHSCALAGDGRVYCWGSNSQDQVGMGADSKQTTPLEVTAAGDDNIDLMVGHHVSCVKKQDASVHCWGTFDDIASFQGVVAPQALTAFGADIGEIVVDTSVCVRRSSDASVACWGYEDTQATTIAAFGNDVVDIDLEFRTVCAVKRGGSVMCRTDRDAPKTLSGVSDAVSVGLRRDHNGLDEPQDVMAAGADGRGWYSFNGGSFAQMNLGEQKVARYNAQHHLIGAVSTTGRVMMWHSAICGGFGDNNPPEDNGSTAGDRRDYDQDAPAVPTGFEMGATGDVALGHEHACVIRASDSSVYCWGRNVEGQIGNGETARECTVGAGNNPGPDGNQMTPFKVRWCP